ncbi:MAG: DUF4266 domain-containing protein [Pseudomonadota bacterium]|nr:DUF4266 domain-containing protein [Pseudomonadota bacterium]
MKNSYGFWSLKLRAKLGFLALGLAALGSSGCASFGAKPWDHDLLAERAMQVDAYPLQSGIDDHIYFSKEASSGGRTFAGGGCGCN